MAEFNYTPSGNTQVKPQVVNVNQASTTSRTLDAISKAVGTVGQAYNQYQKDENANYKYEASNAIFQATQSMWDRSANINPTDVEGTLAMKNDYRNQIQSILDTTPLSDADRITLQNSSRKMDEDLSLMYIKRKHKIDKVAVEEGVTAYMTNIRNNNLATGIDEKAVISGFKTDLKNVGHTDASASSHLAKALYNSKLASVNSETNVKQLKLLEQETNKAVLGIDSKLKGTNEWEAFNGIIAKQVEAIQAKTYEEMATKANDFSITDSAFKKDLDLKKEAGGIKDIDYRLLLQTKKENTFKRKVTLRTRKIAEEDNTLKQFRSNFDNALKRLDLSDEEAKQWFATKKDLDSTYSLEAENTFFANRKVKRKEAQDKFEKDKAKKDNEWFKKTGEAIIKNSNISLEVRELYAKEMAKRKLVPYEEFQAIKDKEAASEEELLKAAVKKQAKQFINEAKLLKSTKGAPNPKQIDNMVLQAGVEEIQANMAFIRDYRLRWYIENDSLVKTSILDTPKSNYIGTDVEAGIRQGLTSVIDAAYTQGNVDSIIAIYNKHGVKSNVGSSISMEAKNSNTALGATQKFARMYSIDPVATQEILGDSFDYVKALNSNVTIDPKTQEPIIVPDVLRKLKDISANPNNYPVEMGVFEEALKDNPDLIFKKKDFIRKAQLLEDPEQALAEVQSEAKRNSEVKNGNFKYYPKTLKAEDNEELSKAIARIQQTSKGAIQGLSYRPLDGNLYYATKYDMYAKPVTTTDSEGKIVYYNDLSNYISDFTKDYKESYGIRYEIQEILPALREKLWDTLAPRKPSEEAVKAFTQTMKN